MPTADRTTVPLDAVPGHLKSFVLRRKLFPILDLYKRVIREHWKCFPLYSIQGSIWGEVRVHPDSASQLTAATQGSCHVHPHAPPPAPPPPGPGASSLAPDHRTSRRPRETFREGASRISPWRRILSFSNPHAIPHPCAFVPPALTCSSPSQCTAS